MLIESVVALPLVLWILLRFTMPAGPFEMDHGNGANPGTFFPLMLVYQFFFYVLFAASTLGAIVAWKHGQGQGAIVFHVASVDALLFNGFIALFYEGYMHSRYPGPTQVMGKSMQRTGPTNYTLNKYAIVMSLGISAVVTFLFGGVFMVMAAQ